MQRYGLHVTANYPGRELEESDKKSRTAKELLEALSFELHKHEEATSFVFVVVRDPDA